MSQMIKQVSPDVRIMLDREHFWVDISSKIEDRAVPLEIDEIEPLIAALKEVLEHVEEAK